MSQFGLHGGQSKLQLSGKRRSKLKLSGNGNECKPLPHTHRPVLLCDLMFEVHV